jgi:hypothetical protein
VKHKPTGPTAAPAGMEAGRRDAEEVTDWEVVDDPFATGPEVDRKKRTFRPNALRDPDEQRLDDLIQHAKLRWSSALDPGFATRYGLDACNKAARVRALAELRALNLVEAGRELAPDELNALMGRTKPQDLPALLAQLDAPARAQVWERLSEDTLKAHKAWAAEPTNRGRLHRKAQMAAANTVAQDILDDAYTVETYTGHSRNDRHSPSKQAYYRDFVDKAERKLARKLKDAAKKMSKTYQDAMEAGEARATAMKARTKAKDGLGKLLRAPAPPSGTKAAEARERAEEALRKLEELERNPPRFGVEGMFFSPLVWGEESWVYNMKPPMRISRRVQRSDTGPRILRPTKLETDPEARGFGRRMPSVGAMIVVDRSGSMSLRDEEVREVMLAAPSSVVIGYSGPHIDFKGDPVVNCYKLAEGDRIRPDMPEANGSNACDLSALQWAFEHRGSRPVLWVSDAEVTGVTVKGGKLHYVDYLDAGLDAQVEAFVVGNADWVGRVSHVKGLLNLLQAWRAGQHFLPEDALYRLPRRAIGSHA